MDLRAGAFTMAVQWHPEAAADHAFVRGGSCTPADESVHIGPRRDNSPLDGTRLTDNHRRNRAGEHPDKPVRVPEGASPPREPLKAKDRTDEVSSGKQARGPRRR
ncbi:hypothetical protein GCM10020220_096460 [Nonomuraea rubra]